MYLADSVQIEHTLSDQRRHHWATAVQIYMTFLGYMTKWERYLHICQFPHFIDDWNEIGRMEESFDRLWIIQNLLEILYNIFSKVYNTSKDQAAEKICFSLQRTGSFQTMYFQEIQIFGIKIYKLCNSSGYTYNIKVYLRKDRQSLAQQLTAEHATVL